MFKTVSAILQQFNSRSVNVYTIFLNAKQCKTFKSVSDYLLSLTLSNISNNNNINNNKEDDKISIIVKNINKKKPSSPYRRDTLFWLDTRERFTYLKMSSYSDERLRNFISCSAPQTLSR